MALALKNCETRASLGSYEPRDCRKRSESLHNHTTFDQPLENRDTVYSKTDRLYLDCEEPQRDKGTEPEHDCWNLEADDCTARRKFTVAEKGEDGNIKGDDKGPYADEHAEVDAEGG